MAMACESRSLEDLLVPHEDESVKNVQSQRLRCSSPSVSDFDCFSITSDRFSVIAGSEAESIFLDPIDLTNGAKINHGKELTATVSRAASEETAEQMMEDDLYNRVKDMIDERSPYNTPCVLDIQRELLRDRVESPLNPVDEVWPNIFIAEKSVAVNKARLKRLGITHIVNAAHGTGVYTGELFYKGMNITYLGLEVDDFAEADISPHFRTCAEFLDEALLTHRGKVLVDSMMGVSRSAVLVAAYLMIFQNMTITEALQEIRKKRAINPNEGFIKQLRQLNETLLEERDEDDFETESVSSVIDTRLCPPGAGNMLGLKANSIMAEEEDSRSVMSSVASSAAAAAWTKHDVPQAVANTPGQRALADDPGQGKDEADIDVDTMIAEWQNRNEKYQKEEWWEAQLMCDEDESLGENKQPDDLDSVTSEDVRMLKERITRPPASRAGSTTSCSSYGDFWRQRLKEIEEEAAAQYQRKEQNAEVSSEASQKQIDDDLQSILSDSSSMYNFCKKNKANLTPLERWKVKRIQFGWNKKDGEKEEKKEDSSDGEAAQSTTMEDVSLTAYQSWKLKQQKKHGSEENKDEILGITCKEDKATIKRRQRREELLEKTRKTLEESQSLCGWETESALSDASIPLSAFCAGAFPSASVFRDDTMSMLSGRSSVFPDQTRKAQPPVPQEPPVCQMGPNGEPMVNIANIQNWISNVVNETLIQKQAELMRASHGHSRASSLFGLGAEMSDGSVVDDDKASVFSRASAQSRTESVLSNRGKSQSMLSSFSSVSAPGSSRSKITTTSVPLYNLFQDQVNLNKLKMMEDDIKSDMRSKMASYERKKITEDNKRSTLYKKKRNKDEEEEKSDDLVDLQTVRSEKAKAPRDYGHSGRLNLPTSSSSSIEEWLKSVRAPESKVKVSAGDGGSEPEEAEDQSEFGFSIHRHSVSSEEDKDEEVSLATKRPSRYQTHADDE